MPTEMELTLKQTQQGVSYEVSNIRVISFTMKMEILLEPTSNKLMVEHVKFDESDTYVLERFDTSAENHVKEILLKLNLPDHRSILTDSKEYVKMVMEGSGVFVRRGGGCELVGVDGCRLSLLSLDSCGDDKVGSSGTNDDVKVKLEGVSLCFLILVERVVVGKGLCPLFLPAPREHLCWSSCGEIPTKVRVFKYSLGYNSFASPPLCPCGQTIAFSCNPLVVGCSRVDSSYMNATDYVDPILPSGSRNFSGISIQDTFSGSSSSGVPCVPSLTFNSHSAKVEITSFSASVRFL
ncbi:hypothetical protein Tco_0859386 [Tanacetum coccineum]|uniref:Uncharacterized protein n=1 Tax=Tanacetum coccineum TaxID=301880 RepID=A0ABQ5BFR8_9ASTR